MTDIGVGVHVTLDKPEDFLLVKETLTRIGVSSRKNKTVYQTAHVLHKRGEYYICHFKELFKLDQKPSNITNEDLERRNLITSLLQDWGLLKITNVSDVEKKSPISSVKVLSFKEKDEWTLTPKYTIGSKR